MLFRWKVVKNLLEISAVVMKLVQCRSCFTKKIALVENNMTFFPSKSLNNWIVKWIFYSDYLKCKTFKYHLENHFSENRFFSLSSFCFLFFWEILNISVDVFGYNKILFLRNKTLKNMDHEFVNMDIPKYFFLN